MQGAARDSTFDILCASIGAAIAADRRLPEIEAVMVRKLFSAPKDCTPMTRPYR